MKCSLHKILFFVLLLVSCTARQVGTSEAVPEPFVNQLSKARSPYLLRLMNQPVDWKTWGEEIFEQASLQNQLILISIGFSASIWCHRMEEEIFTDTLVANLINQHFVPIKVDREERPDVDAHYLDLCQQLAPDSCGWPLQVIALPDGRPIAMSTFLEKEAWVSWLMGYQETFEENPDTLERLADKLEENYVEMPIQGEGVAELPVVLDKDLLEMAELFRSSMDHRHGGLPGTPKFPLASLGEFLLTYETLYTPRGKSVSHDWLKTMAYGSIYDQLGGGFFRLSRDENWREPEFEKMLADNAQLVELYATAYRIDQDPLYEQVVYETLAFLKRELKDPDGGYYASLNAESEGEEGRYYLWSVRDLEVALGPKAELTQRYYNLSLDGNVGFGQNILFRKFEDQQLAIAYNMQLVALQEQIAQARLLLMNERKERVLPARDKKQITAWNAMMISALVHASQSFDEAEWAVEAEDLAQHLVDHMWEEDGSFARFMHRNEAEGRGFLDDYAFAARAFLDVYELTFDERWVELADEIMVKVLSDFWDTESSFFWYTPVDFPFTPKVRKELKDGAIPSSNAIICEVLFRLGRYTNKSEYEFLAKEMLLRMWPEIQAQPTDYPRWGQILLHWKMPAQQILIIGPDCHRIRSEISQMYLPNVQLSGSTFSGQLPLLKGKSSISQTRIYVCQDGDCSGPMGTVNEALSLINTN